MHFLYPGFLLALSALAIPVIIHLFNFRRFRKIYFTNVRFLREIRQDTQSKSRIRHLLVLLSRMLALTFLVLAFAQPYIPLAGARVKAGMKKVSIYIDNSFSMDAQGRSGSLLETAKKKAREIATAYKPSDRFQMLTSDFEARHQRMVSRDEFISLVDEVQPGSSVKTIAEVMQRQEEALDAGEPSSLRYAYLISDFQKSIAQEASRQDTSIQFTFVPVKAYKRNNIYIDTAYLSTPFVQLNDPNELTVVLRNRGNTDAANVPVRLYINGQQKALSSVTAPTGSSGETKLSFTISTPGWQEAMVSIADHPVTFDDDYYLSFNVRGNIEILVINGSTESKSINAVYANDEYFRVKNLPSGQIDYSSFPTSQLIILNELASFSSGLINELKEYVTKGGSVFIVPSETADIITYNDLMNALHIDAFDQKMEMPEKIISVETHSPLFTNVFERGKQMPENLDLPVINSYYTFQRQARSSSESIMRMEGGNPYLLTAGMGKGRVYAIASSLQPEAGSFSRHALFVPIFLRAALQGSSEITPPLIVGANREFVVKDTVVSNDNVFHLVNEGLSFDVIPESRLINSQSILSVHDHVKDAGNYKLTSGGKLISIVSFNYDRKESDLEVLNPEELERFALQQGSTLVKEADSVDLSHSIEQLNEGKKLWKICIILALGFLLTEILLIRYFKRTQAPVR